MGILELINHLNVIEFDVEILIHALQDALELNVIFQLNGDLVIDEGFEETKSR